MFAIVRLYANHVTHTAESKNEKLMSVRGTERVKHVQGMAKLTLPMIVIVVLKVTNNPDSNR